MIVRYGSHNERRPSSWPLARCIRCAFAPAPVAPVFRPAGLTWQFAPRSLLIDLPHQFIPIHASS